MGRLKNIIGKVWEEATKPKSHIKGDDFENYIRKRIFTSKYYTKVSMTHDYNQNKGDFIDKSKEPDFHFRDKKSGKEFMVECKFRTYIYGDEGKGKVKWTYPAQLKRYQQTEKQKKIPVFVALGMGDSNYPDPIFIIPLKKAKYVTLFESFLYKYEIDPDEPLSPKELFNYN